MEWWEVGRLKNSENRKDQSLATSAGMIRASLPTHCKMFYRVKFLAGLFISFVCGASLARHRDHCLYICMEAKNEIPPSGGAIFSQIGASASAGAKYF